MFAYLSVFFLILFLSCSTTTTNNDSDDDSSGDDGSGLENAAVPDGAVDPDSISYVGAFTLPDSGERPDNFEYGGNAMTYRPNGDSSGEDDDYPGSLFITGHDRLPYDELPTGNQIAELSIPVPVNTTSVSELNQATFIQNLAEVVGDLFDDLDELPRIGLQYLNNDLTGERIHISWGQHFQDEDNPSHAFFSTTLDTPNPQGAWYVGDASLYSINGYMFEIPTSWADDNTDSRYLATGRFRDGGWSGKGPALYAYVPWTDAEGTLAAADATLTATTLLQYESTQTNASVTHQAMTGYQQADEWEGGAFISDSEGNTSVIFAGTKGTGDQYWYGYLDSEDPTAPCVDTAFVNEYTTCWNSDGTACPAADLTGCDSHNDSRGWWSSRFDSYLIFYDPSDLAAVAAGTMESYEPQPYGYFDMDEYFFLNPSEIETDMLGTGNQQRYRIGDVTYDRTNRLLYVLELFADEAKPVVHVFSIDS